MTAAVQWLGQKIDELVSSNSMVEADRQWGEDTLVSLHTAAKIETLELDQMGVVPPELWPAFSERLLDQLVREGARAPREQLKTALGNVPFMQMSAAQTFDVSLNFEAGGSQYISCATFMVRKRDDGQIVVAYSLFGKRWIEKGTYALNRRFWEQSPNPQRLKNYLQYGANRAIIRQLRSPQLKNEIKDRR